MEAMDQPKSSAKKTAPYLQVQTNKLKNKTTTPVRLRLLHLENSVDTDLTTVSWPKVPPFSPIVHDEKEDAVCGALYSKLAGIDCSSWPENTTPPVPPTPPLLPATRARVRARVRHFGIAISVPGKSRATSTRGASGWS